MIHVTKINKFFERINPTAQNILLDDSYSMTPLRREGIVTDALNEIMLPGLQGAHAKKKAVLRVALGAFSDDKIQCLTRKPGYFSVTELMKQPVTNDRFGGPGLNSYTALYASMIDGIRSCASAALAMREMLGCQVVKAKVVVLTDGKNCTSNEATPTDVLRAIREVDASLIDLQVIMAYFKTDENIDRTTFMKIAKDCGVHKCHFWADHGDNLTAQRKAFRRLVEILSTVD